MEANRQNELCSSDRLEKSFPTGDVWSFQWIDWLFPIGCETLQHPSLTVPFSFLRFEPPWKEI